MTDVEAHQIPASGFRSALGHARKLVLQSADARKPRDRIVASQHAQAVPVVLRRGVAAFPHLVHQVGPHDEEGASAAPRRHELGGHAHAHLIGFGVVGCHIPHLAQGAKLGQQHVAEERMGIVHLGVEVGEGRPTERALLMAHVVVFVERGEDAVFQGDEEDGRFALDKAGFCHGGPALRPVGGRSRHRWDRRIGGRRR